MEPAPNGTRLRVALTFDAEHPDRPHRPGVTEAILDLLAAEGVVATFFLQGRWVEAHQELSRRFAAEGHLVGNHSFYHARLPLLTGDGIATDIAAADDSIRTIVGVEARPWFRCPFMAGADDQRVLAVIAAAGYRDIGADVILDDWDPARTGPIIAADMIRLVEDIGDGAVVLLHAWPPQTLDALPDAIAGLRALGADFVRIDALESMPGAEPARNGDIPADR